MIHNDQKHRLFVVKNHILESFNHCLAGILFVVAAAAETTKQCAGENPTERGSEMNLLSSGHSFEQFEC